MSLSPRNLPPYEAGKAYTLKSLEGEIIYIPCSKSAMRLLVTGKETEGAFALVGTGGSQGDPIGFHYHREAHDVFLCIKGSCNVWADDKARTMGPGDFASVPPVRHSASGKMLANISRASFINIRSSATTVSSLA